MKKRMSSFVDRGNKLIADGKTVQAIKLVERGMNYYSNNINEAITPYAKSDAGMIVLVLRHIADEIERCNPGAKEFAEGMEKCVIKPHIVETDKVEKPNKW